MTDRLSTNGAWIQWGTNEPEGSQQMVDHLGRFVGKEVVIVQTRNFPHTPATVQFAEFSGLADGRHPRDAGSVPDEGFIQFFVRKHEDYDVHLNPIFIHWGCELLVSERGFQIYEPHTRTLIIVELLPGVSAVDKE